MKTKKLGASFIGSIFFLLFALWAFPQAASATTTTMGLRYNYDVNILFGGGTCASDPGLIEIYDANDVRYVLVGVSNGINVSSICENGGYQFELHFDLMGAIPNTKDLNLPNTVLLHFENGETLTGTFTRIASNTQTGSNIEVAPLSTVTLTFENVNSSGETTIATSSQGVPPPYGFNVSSTTVYYDISSTASFFGTTTVCVQYADTDIVGLESDLRLMHYDHELLAWVDTTISQDILSNTICGGVTSLSPFIVANPPTIAKLIERVKAINIKQSLTNNLEEKLIDAQDALNEENHNFLQSALSKLQTFINKVEAQRGNKITNAQADELHNTATSIMRLLSHVPL